MRLFEGGEIISLISQPRGVASSLGPLSSGSSGSTGLKSGDEVASSRARLPSRPPSRSLARLSDPRGYRRTAVDVLRMRKTRKSSGPRVAAAEGDNEIEMAKADHRIGWLNGWGGRRAKQVVAQDDDYEGANPRGCSTVCESARVRVSLALRAKLILNRNISVE